MSEISEHLDLYALEFSQYSDDADMYPFNIDTVERILRKNVRDMYHNNQGDNKWQIVFVGSHSDCVAAMDAIIARKYALDPRAQWMKVND